MTTSKRRRHNGNFVLLVRILIIFKVSPLRLSLCVLPRRSELTQWTSLTIAHLQLLETCKVWIWWKWPLPLNSLRGLVGCSHWVKRSAGIDDTFIWFTASLRLFTLSCLIFLARGNYKRENSQWCIKSSCTHSWMGVAKLVGPWPSVRDSFRSDKNCGRACSCVSRWGHSCALGWCSLASGFFMDCGSLHAGDVLLLGV